MVSNAFVVDYVKAQVGKQYWNGTFGQLGTRSLYEQNKKRLPAEYKWTYEDKMAKTNCFDCHGLIKSIFWSGNKEHPEKLTYQKEMPDCDIPTAYNRCTSKGPISSIPEIPGLYLFTKNMGHIAVYIGNGLLVEAKGHAWGVVLSKVSERSFAYWGKDTKYIKFDAVPAPVDYSNKVKMLQVWLNNNYKAGLTVDGGAGPLTVKACVKALQTNLNKLYNCGLVVDGGFGPKTQKALNEHMIKHKDKGAQAYLIQGLLYGSGYDCNGFDGSVGDGCKAAIEKFQKAYGLEVDGKVGAETFKRLICR